MLMQGPSVVYLESSYSDSAIVTFFYDCFRTICFAIISSFRSVVHNAKFYDEIFSVQVVQIWISFPWWTGTREDFKEFQRVLCHKILKELLPPESRSGPQWLASAENLLPHGWSHQSLPFSQMSWDLCRNGKCHQLLTNVLELSTQFFQNNFDSNWSGLRQVATRGFKNRKGWQATVEPWLEVSTDAAYAEFSTIYLFTIHQLVASISEHVFFSKHSLAMNRAVVPCMVHGTWLYEGKT